MVTSAVMRQAGKFENNVHGTTIEPKRRLHTSKGPSDRARCRYSAASLVVVSLMFVLHLFWVRSVEAAAAPVAVESIQVSPDSMMPGKYPNITAGIRMKSDDRTKEPVQINVVAVLTRPDRVMKSWQWKMIAISPGDTRSIALPKEYETKLAGVYKIEFAVYSGDMKHRYSALSRTFTIAEQPQQAGKEMPKQEPKGPLAAAAKGKPGLVQEHYKLGAGVYANTLNPAGGVTILFWPNKQVGLQASYTVGTFTSYEARLLARFALPAGFNPYIGIGYLHVAKTENIIGVDTTFTDSAVSGVAGIEVPLGKKLIGYLEVSGANIDLKKNVTNGAQTASATVEYAPVTIGVGLVFPLF